MKKHLLFFLFSFIFIVVLSACSNNTNPESQTNKSKEPKQEVKHDNKSYKDGMDEEHAGSEEVPSNLKKADHPTFKVGSHAIINADHMPGMKGAEATIVGAYNTTAYAVTYTPTTGGKPVPDHKWVIQEELKSAGSEPLKPGAKVTLEADHMKGMKGAAATIDSAEQTTVYMINYFPTSGGAKVTNHKWVTESELSAK